MNCIKECTEKTAFEEQGGVYVGAWATPTPPHSGPPLTVDLYSVDSWLLLHTIEELSDVFNWF
jgi:hypothetical protein